MNFVSHNEFFFIRVRTFILMIGQMEAKLLSE